MLFALCPPIMIALLSKGYQVVSRVYERELKAAMVFLRDLVFLAAVGIERLL